MFDFIKNMAMGAVNAGVQAGGVKYGYSLIDKTQLGFGLAMTAGLAPESITASGDLVYEGYGARLSQSGQVLKNPGMPSSISEGLSRFGPSGIFVAADVYGLYGAYASGGVSAAGTYAVQEIAASGAAAKAAYSTPGAAAGVLIPGTRVTASTFGYLSRYAGASIGGLALGGALGGLVGEIPGVGGPLSYGANLVGTFYGSKFGAAPLRAIGANPVLAGGAALVGLGGAALYGTSQVSKAILQEGYSYSMQRQGIETSGSLAAFQTRGANTMRARAVQAIQRSHINSRSALGNEAALMHRPGRTYNSYF